jgi:hypothetical protein
MICYPQTTFQTSSQVDQECDHDAAYRLCDQRHLQNFLWSHRGKHTRVVGWTAYSRNGVIIPAANAVGQQLLHSPNADLPPRNLELAGTENWSYPYAADQDLRVAFVGKTRAAYADDFRDVPDSKRSTRMSENACHPQNYMKRRSCCLATEDCEPAVWYWR